MGRRQPKQRITTPRYKDRSEGMERRMSYAKTILDKEPEFPKPLEYEDIDAAFTEFAEKVVDLTDPDGKKVPTFTLYSNQRFSEYSQTWEHTDQDGNLLMNFRRVTGTYPETEDTPSSCGTCSVTTGLNMSRCTR